MPVFQSGRGQIPAWCQMQHFDIVELEPGQTHQYEREGPKEKLIVGRGRCRLAHAGREILAAEGANLDIGAGEAPFAVHEVEERAVLVRMCGEWGAECGGSGLFGAENSEEPRDRGDPFAYEKTTNFDRHFHDCDEYWIVFEGRCTAVSEGRIYEVGPGDCVATGMNHHHDIARVEAPVRAVYFETTLEGEKRRGHLWEHTHGPARPHPQRV